MKYLSLLLLLATSIGATELKISIEKYEPTEFEKYLNKTDTTCIVFNIACDTIKLTQSIDSKIQKGDNYINPIIFLYKAIYIQQKQIDSLKMELKNNENR